MLCVVNICHVQRQDAMPHLEAVLNKRLASPDDHGCLTRYSPALIGQQHGADAAKSLIEL